MALRRSEFLLWSLLWIGCWWWVSEGQLARFSGMNGLSNWPAAVFPNYTLHTHVHSGTRDPMSLYFDQDSKYLYVGSRGYAYRFNASDPNNLVYAGAICVFPAGLQQDVGFIRDVIPHPSRRVLYFCNGGLGTAGGDTRIYEYSMDGNWQTGNLIDVAATERFRSPSNSRPRSCYLWTDPKNPSREILYGIFDTTGGATSLFKVQPVGGTSSWVTFSFGSVSLPANDIAADSNYVYFAATGGLYRVPHTDFVFSIGDEAQFFPLGSGSNTAVAVSERAGAIYLANSVGVILMSYLAPPYSLSNFAVVAGGQVNGLFLDESNQVLYVASFNGGINRINLNPFGFWDGWGTTPFNGTRSISSDGLQVLCTNCTSCTTCLDFYAITVDPQSRVGYVASARVDSIVSFQTFDCSSAKSCDSCYTLDPVYCGWCVETGTCSILSSCPSTNWLNSNSSASCPKLLATNPTKIYSGGNSAFTIVGTTFNNPTVRTGAIVRFIDSLSVTTDVPNNQITWINSTHLTIPTPPLAEGIASVQIFFNSAPFTPSTQVTVYGCNRPCGTCYSVDTPLCGFCADSVSCGIQSNCSTSNWFQTCPQISSLSQNSSLDIGGDLLTVTGSLFISSAAYQCRFLFGNTSVLSPAQQVSTSIITCTIPPAPTIPYSGLALFDILLNGLSYVGPLPFNYYNCSSFSSCLDCLDPNKPLCQFDLNRSICYSNCSTCTATSLCPSLVSFFPLSSINNASSNATITIQATMFVNSSLSYRCRYGVGPTSYTFTNATVINSTTITCQIPRYATNMTFQGSTYTGFVPLSVTLGSSTYLNPINFYYYQCSSQTTCTSCVPLSGLHTECRWCLEKAVCADSTTSTISTCNFVGSQFSSCPVLSNISNPSQYHLGLDPLLYINAPVNTFPAQLSYNCSFSIRSIYDIGLFLTITNNTGIGGSPDIVTLARNPARIISQGSFKLPIFADNIENIMGLPTTPDVNLIGMIFKGFISIPLFGTYTFYSVTDDGGRLWVNNTQIINRWVNQGPTLSTGSITLNPGLVPFEYHYYEAGGGEYIELTWSGPGFTRVLIPPSSFRHAPCGSNCDILTPATRVDSSTITCPPAPININVSGSSQVLLTVNVGNFTFSQTQLPVFYYDCSSTVCSGCNDPQKPRCIWCIRENYCGVDAPCVTDTQCPVYNTFYPQTGSTYGGTEVFVQGSFVPNSPDLRCRFDEILVQANYVNNSTVSCLAPPQNANNTGPKVFDLLFQGLSYFKGGISSRFNYYTCSNYNGNCSQCFTYSECSRCINSITFIDECTDAVLCQQPYNISTCPESFSVSPAQTPSSGNTPLQITGPEFPELPNAPYFCSFSNGTSSFLQPATRSVDGKSLSCLTPNFRSRNKKRDILTTWNLQVSISATPYTDPLPLSVYECEGGNSCDSCNSVNTLGVCGWCLSTSTCTSSYFCPLLSDTANTTSFWRNPTCPGFTAISPTYGEVEGGTTVTITGALFHQELNYECSFDGIKVPTTILSPTSLSCVTPKSTIAGSVNVELYLNGNKIPGSIPFEFINCSPIGSKINCDSCIAVNAKCGLCQAATDYCSIETSCSGEWKNSCQNLVLPILVSIFGCFVIAVAIIAIFLYYRRQQRMKAKQLYRPDFITLAFGTTLNSSYNVSRDVKTSLEELEKLLMEDDLKLVSYLSDVTQVTESDDLAKFLVFLFGRHNKIMPLISFAVKLEITTAESSQTLFRANSLASKLFKHYSKMVGCEFLWQRIALIVNELNRAGEPLESKQSSNGTEMQSFLTVNLEVNPDLVEDSQDLELNKLQLELTAGKIYRALTADPKAFPLSFRQVMNLVWNDVGERFNDTETRVKAIGGFLFLRYICAAITSPHIYGLLRTPPNATSQRYLILLSKTLQNIANLVLPGNKEAYMQQMTGFIQSKMDPFRQFCATVSELTNDEQSGKELMQIEIPPVVTENSLVWLYNHICSNKQKLDKQTHEKKDAPFLERLDRIIYAPGLNGEQINKLK